MKFFLLGFFHIYTYTRIHTFDDDTKIRYGLDMNFKLEQQTTTCHVEFHSGLFFFWTCTFIFIYVYISYFLIFYDGNSWGPV